MYVFVKLYVMCFNVCVLVCWLMMRLWGILSRRVAATDNLQTPQDVIDTMVAELNRPSLKSWVGLNTRIHAMKLDCVRSWKTHFSDAQKVVLSGGLLEDASGNHCFVFMLLKGGPSIDRKHVSHVIMCIYKHVSWYMMGPW